MTGSADPLVAAVRRVLPALNFRPDSSQLDAGTMRRARRRPPWTLSLSGVQKLLIYVGIMPAGSGDLAAERAASSALDALTAAARADCEALLVAWEDPAGQPYAAAYAVTSDHRVGRLLGASWIDPNAWRDPMADASKPVDEALDLTLDQLRDLVARGPADDELDRLGAVVDTVLRSAGGEGQTMSGRPGVSAPAAQWSSWLTRYELNVRDEARRVRGGPSAGRIRAAQPAADGPLTGTRVFLSYTRPDATTLARPVLEALRSQGAYVWFDQDEPLDMAMLDAGLAATIESCDAYLLCASNEFFERAGYATQELAWAVQTWRGEAGLRSIVVVTRAETVLLPSLAAEWPVVTLTPELGAVLAAKIRATPSRSRGSNTSPSHRSPPPFDVIADPAVVLTRVRHRRRLYELPAAAVERVMSTSTDRDAEDARIADRLRNVGADLDWDGGLASADRWPSDPLIRSYRWMLGCSRALASVRWPLSGALSDLDDVAGDVEMMATTTPPILDWPDAVGWGDEERRLLLRFHASALRQLALLLSRDQTLGLIEVQQPLLQLWARKVPARRQECVDALLELRLAAGLSWSREPLIWDRLYDYWEHALTGMDTDVVPTEVAFVVAQKVQTVSGVAAQVLWHAVAQACPRRSRSASAPRRTWLRHQPQPNREPVGGSRLRWWSRRAPAG